MYHIECLFILLKRKYNENRLQTKAILPFHDKVDSTSKCDFFVYKIIK